MRMCRLSLFIFSSSPDTSMDVERVARSKRKRNRNFTDSEIMCLIESIASEKEIVMCKLQNASMIKMKKEVWQKITAKINMFGVAVRTDGDLRKKWKDLKLAVITNVREQQKMGVEPPMNLPPYAHTLLKIIGWDNDIPTGTGGESLFNPCQFQG